MTALGHSYGSLTTGLALQHGETGVDDAVFYGSPGIQDPVTGDTGALKIADGHGYVLKADGDPVTQVGNVIGRFGGDPRLHALSTGDATGADGQHLIASHGHSEYTMTKNIGAANVDSTSLYNISTIVAGLPQNAIPAAR